MSIPKKVINFLEKGKVKYELLEQKTVYTAYDKAATLKVKPNIVAKTLIMKADKELLIALVPGNRNLDKNKFQKTVNREQRTKNKEQKVGSKKQIEFASEKTAKLKFKGVQVGSIPPFGTLWKLPVLVEASLMKNPKIIVNSGSYEWSIKIGSAELKKLSPDMVVGNFGKAKK